MTAAEVKTAAADHRPFDPGVGAVVCSHDDDPWPCEVARLLASLDAERARAVEAEKERDRLREALEAIAAPDALLDANDAFAPNAARRMQEQARAALARSEPEGESE